MAIPERMNKVSSRALAAEESRPWLFPDKNQQDQSDKNEADGRYRERNCL